MSPARELLDEGILALEARRARRWLRGGLRPAAFVLSHFAAPWVAAPASSLLLGPLGPGSLPDRAWYAGLLAAACALAGGAAAFLRAAHFWQTEWRAGSLEALCATRQRPAAVVLSVFASAARFALLLVLLPALASLFLAAGGGRSPGALAGILPAVVAACALGAALGTVAFFVEARLVPRPLLWIAALLGVAGVLGLWLRLEAVAGAGDRSWLEHVSLLARALFLLTPVPPLLGAGVPEWWRRGVAEDLALPIGAGAGALAWTIAAFGVTAGAVTAAAGAWRGLVAHPEALFRARAARRAGGEGLDTWRGFRNPVWTRDLRTRLRGREVGDLVLVATVVIAAAAFVPLLLLARDVEDPLDTARVARQVFYWLGLALTGFAGLVAPALGAQAFVMERRCRSLDFLIATPLPAREILSGKVLGAASVTALLLSPAVPLLGLCALFRGASGSQVLELCALLALATLASAFLGVTASAMHPNAAWARWQAQGLALLFLAVPGGALSMAGAVTTPERAAGHFLRPEPGVSLLVIIFAGIVVGLLGMNATERLQHSEE